MPLLVTRLPINFSASGDTDIVPAVAGTRVYVRRLWIFVGGPCNVTIKNGTGGTAETGPLPMNSQGSGFTLDTSGDYWYVTDKGKGFTLNLDVAQQVSGTVWYQQF